MMVGWQVNDDEKMRTNIHTLSGIQTHSLSVQAIKAYASDGMATGTGNQLIVIHGHSPSLHIKTHSYHHTLPEPTPFNFLLREWHMR
jgi:hypothetical protein